MERPRRCNAAEDKRGKLASSYKRTVQYEVGVGTNWYTSLQGGLSGAGASACVKDAYRRLEENYKTGDTDIDIIGLQEGFRRGVQFANVINVSTIVSI